MCCNPKVFPWGPRDQRPVERRSDVLVYTSKPLKHDLEVTGPVQAVLYVSTSVSDTDFTAKLVDVFPDGSARNLTDGILRLRYRESLEKPGAPLPVRFTASRWTPVSPAMFSARAIRFAWRYRAATSRASTAIPIRAGRSPMRSFCGRPRRPCITGGKPRHKSFCQLFRNSPSGIRGRLHAFS